MAARLRPSDRQRLMRALEVVDARPAARSRTGSETPRQPRPGRLRAAASCSAPPRAVLYAACDGALRRDDRDGRARRSARACGARPRPRAAGDEGAWACPSSLRHLRGELTLDEAAAEAKTATRRYAKRQTTWFRHQMMSWKWLCRAIFGKEL